MPGAEVCAFDVDWWFLWSSTQQVGCATTDINGAFEIRFRWCCGWWPWWWWNQRVWALDEVLGERVQAALAGRPELEIGPVGHQPALTALAGLLKDEDIATDRPLAAADAARLESIRSRLAAQAARLRPELARLRIWPWWPWWPWWDCTPDIIFRVTPGLREPRTTTLVDETASTPAGTSRTRSTSCSSPTSALLPADVVSRRRALSSTLYVRRARGHASAATRRSGRRTVTCTRRGVAGTATTTATVRSSAR